MHLKCDGPRAETRFRLSAKWTSPFKSSGASVQSTTARRGGRISGSNVGYIIFRGSVKSTGYPRHFPVSPSLPLPMSPCAITFQLGSNCSWMNRYKKPINKENKNFVSKRHLSKSQHKERFPRLVQVANPDTVYKEHPVTSSTLL
jgi:hypothetical protein